RNGIQDSDDRGLSVEPRRMGEFAVVRSHIDAAIPGRFCAEEVWQDGKGNQHQCVAASCRRRPDFVRPSCALPYEMYAEGGVSTDGSKFELHLTAANKVHGKRAMGAPFNVYLRNINGGMQVAT